MVSRSGSSGGSPARPPPGRPAGGGGGGGGGDPCVYHPRSFKLRFAAEREPGRSNVSLVKPLGLPAVVTEKFYTRPSCREAVDAEREAAALRRVTAAFRCGPRDNYTHPQRTSHEVGWWAEYGRADPPVLRYHIRDSWWVRQRVRLLPQHPPNNAKR